MKILVIGGTGRIGSKVVERLRAKGREVVPAAPSTGVDILTGEGLDAAMAGTSVVVDLANSPSFERDAARTFFERAGNNVLAAEAKAGVKHHVALSVVGTERPEANDYFLAKRAQEDLIRNAGIPYTIIHSTQFYEFLPGIIDSAVEGTKVRLSTANIQPIAAEDVADAVARIALEPPAKGVVEIAGPERAPLDELARRYLQIVKDPREVVGDAQAPYFGAALKTNTLVPEGDAWHGALNLDRWIAQSDVAR